MLRDRTLRLVELAALAAAVFPIVHLRWWAAALTFPALLTAALAARARQRAADRVRDEARRGARPAPAPDP